MSCEFVQADAAYVLGSLSPAERLAYERHLPTCADCSSAVRELAGIPGLLAQVDPAVLEAEAPPPVPATLLPALVREVRASQRRRSALVAAIAAAVAAVAVGSLAVATDLGGRDEQVAAPRVTASSPAPGVAMEAVGHTPVRADLLLAGVAWGTRVDLTCSYEEAERGYEARPDATYALVVRTTDGRSEQVATWQGLPGRTMHVQGATAAQRHDIQRVELQTTDGLVVLQLNV